MRQSSRSAAAVAWLALPTLLVSAGGCADDRIVPPGPDWYLTWHDEFDGDEGPIDTSRWDFDIGTGQSGWGNQELQFYTDRSENVRVDGQGRLAITARREAFGGNAYTSARIKTQRRFSQRYGRMEARIQLPVGTGLWPAFWLLGDNIEEVGWPACGEIDVMEYRGQEPQLVHGSLHGPGYSGGNAITRLFRLEADARFADNFHVFAVEWDPSRISWSVDDVVYQVVTSSQVQGAGDWVFDEPFFLLLNLAVGGTFLGSPDDTTPFPQTMWVDYVRVFQREPPEGL